MSLDDSPGGPVGMTYSCLAPHSGQNFVPGARLWPHLHLPFAFSCAPHSGQNLAFVARGASQLGHEARMVSRQFSLASFLSSSAMAACAHTSSTDRLACAADISTPKSGAQLLHSPRFSFQQLLRHTHVEQRGHCTNFGFSSCTAFLKAVS